ncbi:MULTISPECIES: hypothetical protein [Bacillus cereus group]|uniref:Uncharacterized protein n=1 Tax=Bacillus thuringiensis TaxID=1428 RepID=A0A9X6ZPV1_BACTU|nr:MULTISPECIES: hypothetical protein [Bacillus cereus group]PFJ25975.1 hypothetical protein COJ15_35245 [Bacillus thuringiensis]PGP11561.1 hypothetical protein COA01_35480 [Bacillus cereus]
MNDFRRIFPIFTLILLLCFIYFSAFGVNTEPEIIDASSKSIGKLNFKELSNQVIGNTELSIVLDKDTDCRYVNKNIYNNNASKVEMIPMGCNAASKEKPGFKLLKMDVRSKLYLVEDTWTKGKYLLGDNTDFIEYQTNK